MSDGVAGMAEPQQQQPQPTPSKKKLWRRSAQLLVCCFVVAHTEKKPHSSTQNKQHRILPAKDQREAQADEVAFVNAQLAKEHDELLATVC